MLALKSPTTKSTTLPPSTEFASRPVTQVGYAAVVEYTPMSQSSVDGGATAIAVQKLLTWLKRGVPPFENE